MSIELKKVSKRFGDVAAVSNVSFSVNEGELIALLGPSGGGKTTLAALILGLLAPDTGTVRCGATDLRAVDPAAWRSRIAWVPQRPALLRGTVGENVRLAAPGATDDEVRAALAAAGALDVVDELPDGLQTVIGEGGRVLSAGQAQRLALARAFLADRPLLVLDEPTAHLDAATAADVDRAIARLAAGRTTLLVVHRPELAALADRVVRVAGGTLAEQHAAEAVAA